MANWLEPVEQSVEDLEKLVAAKKAYLAFMKANPLFEEFLTLRNEAGY